jgi:hypothetical protein
MAGWRSGTDRNNGLRSGKKIGTAVTGAAIGRADSHVTRHFGGRGWTPLRNRADQGGGPLPGPVPAQGQPVKPGSVVR